jgi:hypothetical protein
VCTVLSFFQAVAHSVWSGFSKIFHPNVVLFMGACMEPGSLMIVTELMEKGNLESLLGDQKVTLSLFTRMTMMRDVALAVNW